VTRRRRLVPEVIQTSGMDCGPACVTAILRGFGVTASYGRLREACQTGVDGTSIDTIEELMIALGLDAAQTLVPLDHVLAGGRDTPPAIAVTRHPDGATHFVVAWGAALGLVQVMDPGRGRRWVRARAFTDELYVHEMDVPAADWREWAATDEFCEPLAGRMRALGIDDATRRIDRALEDPGWQSIAALDAATRMAAEVVATGALATGAAAARLVQTLAGSPDAIPQAYWHARAAGDEAVRIRGAVLLQVAGRRPPSQASRELAAALDEPPPRPWRTLADAVLAGGAARPVALAGGVVLGALGVIVELVLFRAIFEIGDDLVTVPQLLGVLAALATFLVAMLLVDVATRGEALRLGRHGELRLRAALLGKLPRLGLPYLRSRPVSDMAERGHMLHRLRDLPPLGTRVLRACAEIAATTAALIWLAPACAPLAIALAAAAIVPPFAAQRALAERELRMRTHTGALARFYLDALVGTLPARACGIEPTLRREHEGLLVEWSRAARDEHRLAMAVVAIQVGLGAALAIALVVRHAGGGSPASLLLLVYWALAIPAAGEVLAEALREIPLIRNLTLRLLEPLGALDDEVASEARDPAAGPAALSLSGVSVVLGGHTILRDVELEVAPGEHVAIVGRSGGGKSTLVGLPLGWARPATGELRVDGEVLDGDGLAALRAGTVWVDPAVTLWNDSLVENLRYGQPDADVASIAAAAELEGMIARLPEGLATRLGEGGGLLSGGEGQRVRLGRGLARPAPRLVVLDEPFRGLDRDTRRRQLDATRARWAGATLLCVTHDVAETRAFPRVLVVEDGRIVEDGAPGELAARDGSRYAALLADEGAAAAAWARWTRVRLADGRIEDAP